MLFNVEFVRSYNCISAVLPVGPYAQFGKERASSNGSSLDSRNFRSFQRRLYRNPHMHSISGVTDLTKTKKLIRQPR